MPQSASDPPTEDDVATTAGVTAPQPAADDRRRVRFVLLAGLVSALLIPWIVVLAVVLPHRFVATNWTLTWVGFDIGLLAALAATAVFAARRSHRVVPAASVAAGLLCGDAWFDVTTSHPGGLAVSIASAVVVELPLAALLLYVADRALRAHSVWPRSSPGAGRSGR